MTVLCDVISKERKRSGSSTVARTRTAAKEPAMKATNLMVSYRFSKNKMNIYFMSLAA